MNRQMGVEQRRVARNESGVAARRVGQESLRGRGKRRSWRVQVAAGVGVLVAGISIIGAAPGQSTKYGGLEPVSAAYPVVTIQGGDSLWSVAQRVSSGEDPRVVVERLKELNELESPILQPGQVLRVE